MNTLMMIVVYLGIASYMGCIMFIRLSTWCKHQLDTGGGILCPCSSMACNDPDHKLYNKEENKYIIKGPVIKCEKCFINPATRVKGLGEHVCVQC